jgi:hypothetical protein
MELDFIVLETALVCQKPNNVLLLIWSSFQGCSTQTTIEPGRQHADAHALNNVPDAVSYILVSYILVVSRRIARALITEMRRAATPARTLFCATRALWLHDDFDAAVLSISKPLVELGPVLEPTRVSDYEGRIYLAFRDAIEQ